jgi:hypothetical protein
MSLFMNRIDEARLDEAISEIASTPVDEHEMAAAASRVRSKLAQFAATGVAPAEPFAPQAPTSPPPAKSTTSSPTPSPKTRWCCS